MKNIFFAECFGTFVLVCIGTGVVAHNIVGLVGAALTFGLLVAGMIYLLAEISGAHINPAVTFALALHGAVRWKDACIYWIAQFVGGVLASAILFFSFGGAQNGLGATLLSKGVSPLQGVVVEGLTTFFLMMAVFLLGNMGKRGGLVMAPTIILLVLFAAPFTGAGLNPARSFGPALFTGTLSIFWVYLVGPVVGASLAVPAYRLMTKKG